MPPELLRVFTEAVRLHQLGHLRDAERLYRQVLSLNPRHADSLNLLGVLGSQLGHPHKAVEILGRAIAISPNVASYHFNLGLAQTQVGEPVKAISSFRRAIQLQPDYAEAHIGLGNILLEQEKLADAAACFGRAIALRPNLPEAQNNLGNALKGLNRLDEAEDCYRNVLALRPSYAEGHYNLGSVLKEQGDLDGAAACFRQALALRPDLPEAHNNLGSVLLEQGRRDEAAACFHQSLALRSDFPEAHNNLGNTLRGQEQWSAAADSYHRAIALRPDYVDAHVGLGLTLIEQEKLDEALICFRHVLDLDPTSPDAHNNLGNAFREQDHLNEALGCFHRALELCPDFPKAHHNLGVTLMTLCQVDEAISHLETSIAENSQEFGHWRSYLGALAYGDGQDAEILAKAHRHFGAVFARAATPLATRDPDPNRRLRIGYLSSDLCDHPVALNLMPLLRNHDQSRFECHIFANVAKPDGLTEEIRKLVHQWSDIKQLSDCQLADLIRAEGIDILVILAGRFDANRPTVASWRAAPIQISMHDVSTSGLAEMDYLIADRWLVPSVTTEVFTERVLRLPQFYVADPERDCGLPPLSDIRPQGPPVLSCFNNPTKITPRMLRLWGRILAALPEARLVLKYGRRYQPEDIRRRFAETMQAEGAAPEQICFDLTGWEPTEAFLARYAGIDLALDPAPFCGSTTSFQALSMGVPVVTLPTDRMVSRWTAAMLHSLGLDELIAVSAEDYVAKAVAVVRQAENWRLRRGDIRARLLLSPLCNGPRHARTVERLYRAVWRRHCATVLQNSAA